MIVFKALYFFLYASYGVLMPYIPLFFDTLQMNKRQIGILSMIPNLCSFLVAPLFSVIGDKFNAHGELMLSTIVISTITTYLMYYMRDFASMSFMVTLSSVVRAPIGPQVDSMVIETLEDKSTYGSYRLWGAVGFGIFSFVGGYITSSTKNNDKNTDITSENSSSNGSKEHEENSYFLYLFFIYACFCFIASFIVLIQMHDENEKSMAIRIEDSVVYDKQAILNNNDSGNSSGNSSGNNDKNSSIGGNNSGISCGVSNNSLDETFHGDSTDNVDGDIELQRLVEPVSEVDSGRKISSGGSNSSRSNGGGVSVDNTSSNSSNSSNKATAASNNSNNNIIYTVASVFYYNPSVSIFAIVVFLSGIGSGVIDVFLFLRLKQLGASGVVMGISRFITCAAEVPMFQIAGELQKRFGTWPVMTVTQIAFVLRFTYYSELVNPWFVLPCEVLHGLTFATMWNVSCTYASEISPPGCHSTMQALLEGLHWGVGSGLGALLGGFYYDLYGAVPLFQISAVVSLFSTVLAVLASRYCSTVVNTGRNSGNMNNNKQEKYSLLSSPDQDTTSFEHDASLEGGQFDGAATDTDSIQS